MNDNTDKGFTLQVRIRVKEKIKETQELKHEIQEKELQVERNKLYIKKLNDWLEDEGERPELMTAKIASGGKRTGNRSKNMPLRQARWTDMSMEMIAGSILDANIGKIFKPKEVANQVYEIKSDADLRMVLSNLRATLQRGAKKGLWNRPGQGKFTSNKQSKPLT